MKVLVADYFFKNIPNDKMEFIFNKLHSFYDAMKENRENLFNMPNGFYIKKIKNSNCIYEFRINSGDRIFFTLKNSNREVNDKCLTFLLYSTHDFAVKKVLRKEHNLSIWEDFKIQLENDTLDPSTEDYITQNIILYEVIDDNKFIENFSNRKYKYFYLNDEQFEALSFSTPFFVAGSAGSGKSTLTLRKILNIESFNYLYNFNNILYITSNQYLRDNIEEQYFEFRDNKNHSITQFETLKNLFSKYINKDEMLIGYREFLSFLYFSFPEIKKTSLTPEEIYTEINGTIKGLMCSNTPDNWNRDILSNYISLDEYINLPSKYSTLDNDSKHKIYSITLKYTEWLKSHKYLDYNDVASRILKNNNSTFDFLIIDEIQDLTEIQIYSLFSLVSSTKNIFIAGDIHQMINSTFFSFERMKNLFYTKYHTNLNIKLLTKNYRSCKNVVDIANYFSELRSNYIGNLGVNDYKENAIQKEGTVILTHTDINAIIEAQNDVSYAIIVLNNESKQHLLEQLENKHRVFTIYEIKGLEYPNIICYNLSSETENYWKIIFDKKAKKDQRYRKFFNIFYVGITRAQEKLIIMEDNIANPLLSSLKDFLTIEKNIVIEHQQKSESELKKDWLSEGIKLYKMEKIEEAKYAFEMAGEPLWILEYELKQLIKNKKYEESYEYFINHDFKEKKTKYKTYIIDNIIEDDQLILALKLIKKFGISYREKEIKTNLSSKIENNYFDKESLKELIDILTEKKDSSLLGKIFISLKEYRSALKYFEIANDHNNINQCRAFILKNKFSHFENIDKKIKTLIEIIGNKGINSYNKENKMTPLQNSILIQEDFDISTMIIYLGGNIHFLIKNRYPIHFYYLAYHYSSFEKAVEFIHFCLENNLSFDDANFLEVFTQYPKIFKYLLNEKILTEFDEPCRYLKIHIDDDDIPLNRRLMLLKRMLKNWIIKTKGIKRKGY